MRRFPVAFALFVAVVSLALSPAAVAQEATPDPVTGRTVASGSLEILAPGTGLLNLGRISLAPGAVLPFDPLDPAATLIYIAAGELTFQVEEPMTVTRGIAPGTPVPTEPETVAANTEFTLRDGDSALFPPAIRGEVRNDGNEEATAWLVNVAVLTDAAATPTP